MQRRTSLLLATAMALGLMACGDPDRGPTAEQGNAGAAAEPAPRSPLPAEAAEQPGSAEMIEVQVFFTRNEQPRAVSRRVPRTEAVLQATLEELLQGPTAEEQAAGLTSFFSPATSGMLRRVRIDEDGRAVVDFADFSRIIPNASTSAGSAMLLGKLNSTVFQFPNVRSVEYRFEGSCEAFWNWIQRDCQVVTRP